MTKKYIFVVGGVMSSVGKGITTASLGKILQARGYAVTAIKIDAYVNLDAGTMNPTEHGEVFVTDDGDETDQDIGNYERFLETDIPSDNYMTTGRVYESVIHRERNLEYGGKCVQVVPHIPQEVIRRIKTAARKAKAEITVIEVGGTVGEYENILFLEAGRMMKLEAPQDVLFVLVSYLPIPQMVGEMKTKPTQHAARSLNATGIQADFIVARSEQALDKKRREKLATFCNIDPNAAISAPDAPSIYHVPQILEEQSLTDQVLRKFGLAKGRKNLRRWEKFVEETKALTKTVKIAVVGKYFGTGTFTLADSYISVIEAAKHGSWANRVKPELTWIDSEKYETDPERVSELGEFDGVIVPGGFGGRGIEGIITAITYVREHRIPYLGLCYGMQLASIEFARHVAGLEGAHTTEVKKRPTHPVIHIMPEQEKRLLKLEYGGTMRLGAYPCKLLRGSIVAEAYEAAQRRNPSEVRLGRTKGGGATSVSERHRHRYEFNNAYRKSLEEAGLVISGTSPDRGLVEIIELPRETHPFFVGTQFHPEFKSRPLRPHPLFVSFAKAAKARSKSR